MGATQNGKKIQVFLPMCTLRVQNVRKGTTWYIIVIGLSKRGVTIKLCIMDTPAGKKVASWKFVL